MTLEQQHSVTVLMYSNVKKLSKTKHCVVEILSKVKMQIN